MHINAEGNLLHKFLFLSSLYLQTYWFEVNVGGPSCLNQKKPYIWENNLCLCLILWGGSKYS